MFAIPLWLSGVLYDSQRLLYGLQQEIRVTELFELERSLFPAPGGGSWSEWFFTHNTPSLDIMTGLTYLAYIPFVLFVAAALFRIDKERCLRFAWAFFAVNVIGVIVYLAYPAAPPWYVMEHGAGPADLSVLGNPAGAARFDELFGITVFKDFYARNPNVFGAMPSLHVAYPALAAVLCRSSTPWLRHFTAAFTVVMMFSAVYLSHHYILDVAAGASIATVCGVAALRARRPASLAFSDPLHTPLISQTN